MSPESVFEPASRTRRSPVGRETTVVSTRSAQSSSVPTPTEERLVLDAGSKTLSGDTLGLEGYGHVVEYPQLAIAKLSEEHGHVSAAGSNAKPGIGERVTVIPNHACVVSNLHDTVYAVRGGRVERVLPVAARGRVT